MAGKNSNQAGSLSDQAEDIRDEVATSAKSIKASASAAAEGYRDAASDQIRSVKDSATGIAQDLRDNAASLAVDLKERAAGHASEARDIVSNLANEARTKITDAIEQQKAAGADQLASISKAAQNAAGDLDEKNPQVARLVRDAASTVDRFAGDLRSSSLGDVVGSLSNFARSQPVAFFAGSVLAGFVLARFLKSEQPGPASRATYDRARLG